MKSRPFQPTPENPKKASGRRIDFGGIPHPPESFIPPAFIPEPPLPTPDRVRPKSQKGNGRA